MPTENHITLSTSVDVSRKSFDLFAKWVYLNPRIRRSVVDGITYFAMSDLVSEITDARRITDRRSNRRVRRSPQRKSVICMSSAICQRRNQSRPLRRSCFVLLQPVRENKTPVGECDSTGVLRTYEELKMILSEQTSEVKKTAKSPDSLRQSMGV